jgi:hypothetical protein
MICQSFGSGRRDAARPPPALQDEAREREICGPCSAALQEAGYLGGEGNGLRRGKRLDQAPARIDRTPRALTSPWGQRVVKARRRARQSRENSTSREKKEGAPTKDRAVRYTLDLSREQHRFLKRYAFEAETDASVVMRALLALLKNDDTVARKVRSALEESGRITGMIQWNI